MSDRIRLITRVALFAALVYVLSWATVYLPNVNLAFFIAFSAGYVWGASSGLLVGGIGMWLWSNFNPFGPAVLPVSIAQVLGMAMCGLIGNLYRQVDAKLNSNWGRRTALAIAAVACTVIFYIPVTLADAWVSGAFWLRVSQGAIWVGISLVANVMIFPLLFGATRHVYDRESGLSWQSRY